MLSAAAATAAGLCAITLLAAPAAAQAHLLVPVNVALLRPALIRYRGYAAGELAAISTQLQTLASAEQGGNLAAAQRDWLPAHLDWLAIGQDDGAYGAFGALGREIDGTAAGYVGGVSSSAFSGFHRIEYELWTEQNLPAALAATDQLTQLIAKLQSLGMKHELPGTATALQSWVLRAHEILEDADRDTLTGADEYGSGTGVASVRADVAATREMISLLRPVLDPRAPKLAARGDGDLARIDRVTSSLRVHGHWIAVAELPRTSRERLDAAVDEALENLAPISDIIHVSGAGG